MHMTTTKNNMPKVFDFDNHKVRTWLDEDNNPFFVAKDVCEVLEINNPRHAVKNIEGRLKEAGLEGVISNDTLLKTTGGKQTLITINEQGLYDIIFASRKKQAIKFRTWVTSQVLPQLRQTGNYNHEQPKLLDNTQANLARATINDFIKDYGTKHAPKGQLINTRKACMQVHGFIHKYFNIASYKNLDAGELVSLTQTLNDNTKTIFASVRDLFVVNLKDHNAITQAGNLIRIKDESGSVYAYSLDYILALVNKEQHAKPAQDSKQALKDSSANTPNTPIPHHLETSVLINCHKQIDMVKSRESNLDVEQSISIMQGIAPSFKLCTTNIEMVIQSMFVEHCTATKNTSAKAVLDNIAYVVL